MKALFKIFICLTLVVVCFSSCITSKDTNLMQDIDKDYSTIPPPDEYRIIPGDILQVVVYVYDDVETEKLFRGYTPQKVSDRLAELGTGAYGTWGGATDEGTRGASPIVVYADGTINFPYLGRIYVADLTLLEIRNLLTARLKEISANASANVTLRNSFFSILGEAGARRIDLKSNSMTIYQALATAGNLGNYAKRDKVNIIRQANGETIVKTFDLRSKDIINTEFYYIQPNDVIYFPQSSGKFFGATSSFVGFFGLITSFVTILVMAIRLF